MKAPGWSPFAWLLFDLQRTITFGYLRQRWTRAALIVISIALGVAILVATRALSQNLNKATQSAANPLSGHFHLLVVNGQTGVPLSLVEEIRRAKNDPNGIPEIADAQPLVLGRVAIPELGKECSVLLLGLEPPPGSLLDGQPATDETGATVDVPSFGVQVLSTRPTGLQLVQLVANLRRPAFLHDDLAKKLDGKTGDFHVHLAGKEMAVTSLGTVKILDPKADPLEKDALFMDVKDAAALVYPDRKVNGSEARYVSQINIRLHSKDDAEKVRPRLQALVPTPCKVETVEANMESVHDITAGLELGFSLGGAGALVVGLFLVYNALSVSVAERRHDIGILRSVGATRGQVASLFVLEAAVLGLIGSLLALPIGYCLAWLGLGPMSRAMNDLFMAAEVPNIELGWPLMGLAVASGVLTTVLAALVPALQAAGEEPANAVRRVPMVIHFFYRVMQLSGSALLVGIGLAFVLFREYLPLRVGVFVGIVFILVGALVLTPLLAEIIGRFLQPAFRRVFGLVGRLAADNLARAPGRTGLVIAALAATGALMVETAGFINSTEHAVFTWLDDKIGAEPVTSGTTALPMDERVGDQLKSLPQVRTVLPVRTVGLEFRHRIVLLFAIDVDAFDDRPDDEGLPPFQHGLAQLLREKRELRKPGTALVSENFAALYHIAPGDRFTIDGLNEELELQCVGTIVDYSWNRGTIVVDRKWYCERFQDHQVNIFDVYLRPGSDRAAVQREMESRWYKSDLVAVISREDTLTILGKQLRQIYGMAYAQESVVGLVSLLGVISALFISVLQRRRELGLLRSIGATRAQVLSAVLAEAVLMGIIGAVLGFGIGLLLQWYLLDLALFDESGFTFPLRVPWAAAAMVMGLSVVLATVVGLWPAYYATRMRIAEAIQYE
jgi:putative ABC transport system permease protein